MGQHAPGGGGPLRRSQVRPFALRGGVRVVSPVDPFSALHILDGPAVTGHDPPHPRKEFLTPRIVVDRWVPSELQIPVRRDNLNVRRGEKGPR